MNASARQNQLIRFGLIGPGGESLVPEFPRLAPDHVGVFLKEAPERTAISIDGEFFRRLPDGRWRHLEEIIDEGSGHMSYRTWDSSTPEYITSIYPKEWADVRVIELPDFTAES